MHMRAHQCMHYLEPGRLKNGIAWRHEKRGRKQTKTRLEKAKRLKSSVMGRRKYQKGK